MKIAIIGAGNGGQALAAVLAMRGHGVSLYNRSEQRILPLLFQKKIKVEGESKGVGKLEYVGTDIASAIRGRELIMVVLPAYAHASIAEKLAPCIQEGQKIILNPGRTGGALEFYRIFKSFGVHKKVILAEAQTFVFASRISGPGMVRIFRIKNAVPVATLPATKNRFLEPIINEVLPEFTIAKNVLYTSFNNIGAIFHPAAIIMNSGWIESTHGDFQFYLDGISPSVAKVLETIDSERCCVSKAFGVSAMSARNWLDYAYDVKGEDLYSAIQKNDGYRGIKAPINMDNRYIMEDVPMSLVPISLFGKTLGISTKIIDSIVNIAGTIMSRDFWKEGRSLEKLGIERMTIDELWNFVETGETDHE